MPDLSDPLDRRPAQVSPVETPRLRDLLTVAVVAVAGLYLGRSVLIPITLAVLLSFLLAPLVNLLRRVHLGRVPSVLLAMLLALALILALGGLIGTQVAGLAEDLPRYMVTIRQKIDTVQQAMLSRMTAFTHSLVHHPAHVGGTANTRPGAAQIRKSSAATPSAETQKPIAVEVHQPDQTLVQLAQRVVSPAVEPLLYGHSTGLSHFAMVRSATFWTWLWGPIGLILSTPLTLCLVVLGRHVTRLEFFDVLLGNSPALSPVESFYQRMLADDPEEVHDHAEALLKRQSLASYYDEVGCRVYGSL